MFPAQNVQYNQVCGRIIGYQYGQPEAFVAGNIGKPQTIDGAYVDGISLTYGNPRQHIWSFAAALDERSGLRAANNGNYRAQCECTDSTQSTYADLEVRLCSYSHAPIENTPVELVEIYVK